MFAKSPSLGKRRVGIATMWDEFANLTDIPEPSLISPLRRERLIFNNDFIHLLILSLYIFSQYLIDFTIISLFHNIFSCR